MRALTRLSLPPMLVSRRKARGYHPPPFPASGDAMQRWPAALAAICLSITADPVGAESREPCAHRDAERRPFFGDLHVHTAYSQDASTQGTRATPRDAYRFARGEPLGIQPFGPDGTALRTVRLDRPLDFAAVTDHAEQIGEVHVCRTPGTRGPASR